MHVTKVADGPGDEFRTLMAMEFMRPVKMGKLTEYQRSALNRDLDGPSLMMQFVLLVDFKFRMSKIWRKTSRTLRRFFWTYIGARWKKSKWALSSVEHEESIENNQQTGEECSRPSREAYPGLPTNSLRKGTKRTPQIRSGAPWRRLKEERADECNFEPVEDDEDEYQEITCID